MPNLDSHAENLDVDVAVIGAGIAGVSTASALAKDGASVALIDFRERTPPQFRAEKIGQSQVDSFEAFGLGTAAKRQLDQFNGVWVHRFGRVVTRGREPEYSSPYGDLVNALRDALPPSVLRIHGRVEDVEATAENQLLVMGDGRRISARLVVMATGPGDSLRNRLGMKNEVLSAGHSLSIGFDLANPQSELKFPSLVWILEAPADKTAYLTIFPMGKVMRGNLFTYRSADDPWIARLRQEPDAAMAELFPDLGRIYRPLRVADRVQLRPTDLAHTRGHYRPGVVAIGDAFFVACPSTGTGIHKALNDVSVLRQLMPKWLSTPGMGTEKIATFYDDPAKTAVDEASLNLSFKERAVRLDQSLGGAMLRMRRNVFWHTAYGMRDLLRRDAA